jgi:NADH-quinone oxidoreductase subunit K
MSIANLIILSALLFTVGTVGVILKKNVISIFLCIELMLNAVNLTFIAFARFLNEAGGQIIVFFVMVVAAAEAAVGLAITVALYRNRNSLSIDDVDNLKW